MVIWAALIGSVLGTFVGFGVLVVSRRNRYFPFGPGLATGTAIVVLFADRFQR
jgi:prepilin signal peptidase PulO-like enzyme (type II secretory pathway)